MKLFTIEIQTVNGQTAAAIYERTGLKTALSAHHQTMASALANPECTEVLSMVINSDGGVYKSEQWRSELPEEETIEE